MVIFFIILLAVSLIGLFGLIVLRRYELNTGRVIFANVRPTVGAWLGFALHFTERVAPALVRHFAMRLYRRGRELARRTLAFVLVHTERWLEQTLHGLRQSTAKEGGGEASAFLREVAEHKKQLQEKTTEKGAIYEE